MLKKNIAPVVATILSALTFIIIGSCFSAFFYKKEVVKVENPKLILFSGVSAFDESGQSEITEIELSEMKLGLKPATGEEDSQTNIPVTITDKKGSEGQFAKFQIKTAETVNVYVVNVKIEGENASRELDNERENIMVAIKEFGGEALNLSGEKILLGKLDASQDNQTLTFLIWLSSKVSDIVESSTISFV